MAIDEQKTERGGRRIRGTMKPYTIRPGPASRMKNVRDRASEGGG